MNNPEKTGTFYAVEGELVHESDYTPPEPVRQESMTKPAKAAPEKAEQAKE